MIFVGGRKRLFWLGMIWFFKNLMFFFISVMDYKCLFLKIIENDLIFFMYEKLCSYLVGVCVDCLIFFS